MALELANYSAPADKPSADSRALVKREAAGESSAESGAESTNDDARQRLLDDARSAPQPASLKTAATEAGDAGSILRSFIRGVLPPAERLIKASNYYLGTHIDSEFFAKPKDSSVLEQTAHDFGEMVPTAIALGVAELALRRFIPFQMQLSYTMGSAALRAGESLTATGLAQGLETGATSRFLGGLNGIAGRTLSFGGTQVNRYGNSLMGAGFGMRANEFLLQGSASAALLDPDDFSKNFLAVPLQGIMIRQVAMGAVGAWLPDICRLLP